MKTATVNFKTDLYTKAKAQDVAKKLGIPLSSLLNAYLYELASTGTVHFSVSEPMTAKMELLIAEAEGEIQAGHVSERFNNVEELFNHLDSVK